MVIAAGNTLVDQIISVSDLPLQGGKRSGRCLAAAPGGGAANTIAVAASIGTPTRFFTAFGRDLYGERLITGYTAMGVDLRCEFSDSTPISLVFVDADRERTLITIRNDVEPKAESFPGVLAGADDLFFLHLGSATARAAFASRSEARLVLPGRQVAAELDTATEWSVVLASSDETPRPSDADLKLLGCELFVLTSGGDGGEWWDGGSWHSFSTPLVTPTDIVDTCGAGDAFAGGVLSGLDQGLNNKEAIELGAEQGAACITRQGAWPLNDWMNANTFQPLLPH